jgi:N-acetylglucosamine kinase-like BadF-type ATPase
MILIADSGSTKTSWLSINIDGKQVFKANTKGLNPSVFNAKTLKKRLHKNKKLNKNKSLIKIVYFYGAGCGTKTPKQILKNILQDFFINAKIYIKEDTYAAVYSVTNKPAIVCILGTGSNCTYFDGEKIHQKIDSLGYVVMDDASGNYYGRILLRDYFYNKMPKEFAENFALNYNLDADEIKINLYKKENPNTFLASFSYFLVENKNCEYAQDVIKKGLTSFVKNQILQYKESKDLPIHFVGSLAYFIKDEIKQVFEDFNLKLGKFEKKPILGLTDYHTVQIK